MLKYAGVPVNEGVLTDPDRIKLKHIEDTFKRDIEDFKQTGDMSDALYDALYDYYFDDMPYAVKKGKDEHQDPYQWIGDRFAQDIGLDEGWKGALVGAGLGSALGSVIPGIGPAIGAIAGGYTGYHQGDDIAADVEKQKQQAQPDHKHAPVSEGSCNMTMEGEYCPEHGLAECGMASGGAVGMPYSMGEAEDDAVAILPLNMVEEKDDPINYNAAMTGSYYEGKETKTQEGDALLARIKSLALLR